MATKELTLHQQLVQEQYGTAPKNIEEVPKVKDLDDAMMQKYRDMANTRGDYSMIDPACFATPTMGEMLEEDLMYSIYKKIQEETTGDITEDAILNRAFYSEAPITTELGYSPEHNIFMLKFVEIKQEKNDWILNKIDGDTVSIAMNKIDDGNTGFTINNISYKNFKDYCTQFGSGGEIQLRFAGINTPEIPHLEAQPIDPKKIEKIAFKDIKSNANHKVEYRYIKYPITKNGKDVKSVWGADFEEMSTWKSRSRKDDELLSFHVVEDRDSGKKTYYEICENFSVDTSKMPDKGSLEYKAIVQVDDSTKNSVVAGYRAKRKVKDMLHKVQDKEMYVMINAGGVEPRKNSNRTSIAFNNWWYTGDTLDLLVKEWEKTIDDIGQSGLSYNAYGMDTYGRFLSTIYVKEKIRNEKGDFVETWVNLAKYILADNETMTEGQPDYTGSPELNEAANGISDAFNLWSYDKNNIKWLDSFENMSKNSYNDKLAFHKKIVGYDFTKSRDCAVMLGDTLLLIPPQSIRNVSHNSYEKVATMRGKGTMVKSNTTREHMMELELFFYGESGINGIPTEVTLPNGQKTTYHMNGLRSLVSQFKIAPFLPIENGYINDVLGIEAVTLMNLHIETVEGYPRLLKAVLSLRDFNYRVFMPDVPVDDKGYDGSESSKGLSELNPMFAKCFEWELFRYYYQRAIQQGESLKWIKDNAGFNAYDYNKFFYANKNTLQPMGMCSSKIGFHVPDKQWLSEALLVKKERDQNRTNIAPIELTKQGAEYLKSLLPVSVYLNDIASKKNEAYQNSVKTALANHDPSSDKYMMVTEVLGDKTQEESTLKDVLNTGGTLLYLKDGDKKKVGTYVVNNILKPIFDPIVSELSKNKGVSAVRVDEVHVTPRNSSSTTEMLKYVVNITPNFKDLTSEDVTSIKETMALALGKDFDGNFTNEDIFKDGVLKIEFTMSFDPETRELYKDEETLSIVPTSDYKILQIVKTQFGQTNDNGSVEENDDDDTSFNEHNKDLAFSVQDYKNPANMPFVPYATDIMVKRMAVSVGNQFTEVSLKAVDGYAPQYMGGQDTTIELDLITDDKLIVSAINALPSFAIDMTKDYRRIMSCWPLKVESELIQLMGVSEVLIDNIEIATVEGFPGLYEIHMRLTSVDRTQRQREALRKLNAPNNSGYLGSMNNKSDLSIKSFFALDTALSEAELYPDLDIPTLEELAMKGYRFIKYSGKGRKYPDPDFYVVYSFPYTAMIIKDMIDKFLEEQVFNPDAENANDKIELLDNNGMKLVKKIAATIGVETVEQNDVATQYSNILKSAQEEMQKQEYETLDKKTKEAVEENNEMSYIINYLTACDIQDGWEVKPGWKAPLCTHYTNQALEDMTLSDATEEQKNNAYAKEILELRRKAIRHINAMLAGPINYEPPTESFMKSSGPMVQITHAVQRVFDSEDGKALLKILCPLDNLVSNDIHITDNDTPNGEKYFEKANILRYISGFVYAAGCAATGQEDFHEGTKSDKWSPSQFEMDSDGNVKYAVDKDGKKIQHNHGYVPMPHVIVDESAPSNTGNERDFDYAKRWGVEFGMFGIKRYSGKEIGKMMHPNNRSITYMDEKAQSIYADKNGKMIYKAGFADPYYNTSDRNSERAQRYKHALMVSSGAGAEALIRVMLLHLKRQILDGMFFSELDIISQDYDRICNDMQTVDGQVDDFGGIIPADVITELLDNMPESFGRSFCTRMIYPFLSVITDNHPTYNEWLTQRNYDALNILTGAATPTGSGVTQIDKFLRACSGIGMFKRDNKKKKSDVSDSQKIINNLMKEVYISASEDPRLYVMHSFYDMLINDKRGRLVRAFPTYYMVFLDEGRKLGSWKLHDNFYNMSAINEIQVVKSRKIAADTCRIVMSNMYNSYAQDHDIETTQQYIDVYGLRDVFDSVFSPSKYFNKEEMLRNRMTIPDKVVLQPGIRIHVRMGYTADGANLPVVFNGKIAEVGVEDVVEIIAQGDGHELMNPLNAFGALETTALKEAQKKITVFKDLRGSLARGGESPRNLLALILSAKHGGLVKNAMNEWFDGRWFNDNPFGIMHFGDPKMRDIFTQGEVVQNLYEVSDAALLKGMEELLSTYNDKNSSPTINTTIQDKTFWDLLHMCANSGIEYYGAVRDFGMRSTVFLGKANHYYAYAYKKVDGKLVEKRKPFQQYHHYESYTDIVYNTIKASERDIKTNAMGTWESTSPLWGREQATVGPVYLDMNIFPEYQKSMTVDTGLLAAGNGGIDFPLFNHYGEKWSMDANDDKVNKELAWRMTMNVLRQSVKDMYQGELCVIGDPSIKPYDRFFVTDTYEDMEGQMEVEAVVYSMNADTGFTTTISPDVIVRHNDPHEVSRQRLFSTFAAMTKVAVTTRLAFINTFAAVDSKLMRAIAKSDSLHGLMAHTGKTATNLSDAVGLSKYAESNPALGRLLNKLSSSTGGSIAETNLLRHTDLIDDMAKLVFNSSVDLSKTDDIVLLAKSLDMVGSYDNLEYTEAMKDIFLKNEGYLHMDKANVKQAIINAENASDKIDDAFKAAFKSDLTSNNGFVTLLNNHMSQNNINKSQDVADAIKSIITTPDNHKANMRHLGTLLKDDEVIKVLSSNSDISNKLRYYVDGAEDLFKIGASGTTKISSLKSLLKSDDIVDSLKAVFKFGLRFNVGTIAVEILKATFLTVMANNANEFLTRWIKSVQALTVYPINRNGRALIAGMNGHKGAVFGVPPKDGYNSIQGMIMRTVDVFEKGLPFLGTFIVNELVNRDVYDSTVEQWKQNLGIIEHEDVELQSEVFNQNLYDTLSNELTSRMKTAHSLKTRARIRKLTKDESATKSYKSYSNIGVSIEELGTNKNLVKMVHIKDDMDIMKALTDQSDAGVKMSLAHDEGSGTVAVKFENGVQQVKFLVYDDGIYDMPILQEEGIYIINRLVNKHALKNKVIHFMSGTRINHKKTWKNTGFSFTLECKDSKKLDIALSEVKEETKWVITDKDTQYLFEYKMNGDQAVVNMFAPYKGE